MNNIIAKGLVGGKIYKITSSIIRAPGKAAFPLMVLFSLFADMFF